MRSDLIEIVIFIMLTSQFLAITWLLFERDRLVKFNNKQLEFNKMASFQIKQLTETTQELKQVIELATLDMALVEGTDDEIRRN